MEPLAPQKTLQKDVNELSVLIIGLLFIGNTASTLIVLMNPIISLKTYVIISIPVLVALTIYVIRLCLIYKKQSIKKPVLAAISALITSSFLTGIIAGVGQLFVLIINLDSNGNAAGAVQELAYALPVVSIIALIIIYGAVLYLVLSFIPGKFIPGLKYFKNPDSEDIPPSLVESNTVGPTTFAPLQTPLPPITSTLPPKEPPTSPPPAPPAT